MDSATSHEATCTVSLLFIHLSCCQHSISILLQIATFAGGIYFTWISHFQLSDFSQAVIVSDDTGVQSKCISVSAVVLVCVAPVSNFINQLLQVVAVQVGLLARGISHYVIRDV